MEKTLTKEKTSVILNLYYDGKSEWNIQLNKKFQKITKNDIEDLFIIGKQLNKMIEKIIEEKKNQKNQKNLTKELKGGNKK
jgi:hypothetical protein